MSKQKNDDFLLQRARQGDRDAFDMLVLKYQNRVINLVSRYVRNHSDALDVAQNSFVRAWLALPRFRGDSAFYTWLYRIAVNAAKNHLVSEVRHMMDNSVTGRGDCKHGGTVLQDNVTPEVLLSRDELQANLLSSIRQLPDELRLTIMHREIDCMSYRQIAEIMDCPVGTVRSRIFRAREALDKHLCTLSSMDE